MAHSPSSRRGRLDLSVWNSRRIRELKAEIKEKLAAIDSTEKTIRYIFSELNRLSESEDTENLLRTLILCMHGIILHSKNLVLRPAELSTLESTAQNILTIRGIDPEKSRLGFLFSEYYLAQSQVARAEGQHWRSAWVQNLAGICTGKNDSESELDGSLMLAAGLRSQRLGFGRTCRTELESALKLPLSRANLFRVTIAIVQQDRMSIDYEACRKRIADGLKLELTDAERQAFEWEQLCLDARESGSILKILQATSNKGSHYVAGYAVQAYLWRALSNESLVFRMTTLQRTARADALRLAQTGLIYRCADAITRFDDDDENATKKLDRLGGMLLRRSELPSVDREMLFLAAAYNKLKHHGLTPFAQLCLDAYRQLSLGISDGRTDDCLGVINQTH